MDKRLCTDLRKIFPNQTIKPFRMIFR